MDMDYADKLSIAELEWYNQFIKEELGATFSKDPKKNLNKTPESQRVIYNENNRRNNDVQGVNRATGRLYNVEDSKSLTSDSCEGAIIEQIDGLLQTESENADEAFSIFKASKRGVKRARKQSSK